MNINLTFKDPSAGNAVLQEFAKNHGWQPQVPDPSSGEQIANPITLEQHITKILTRFISESALNAARNAKLRAYEAENQEKLKAERDAIKNKSDEEMNAIIQQSGITVTPTQSQAVPV